MSYAATTVENQPDASKPGGRRERKLRIMIDHIGEVAWDLFEKQGFGAVTMEAIAAAADVAKGTLYKHFPVKEALIQHRFDKDRGEQADTVSAAIMAKGTCAERLMHLLEEEAIYLEKMRPYVGPFILYRFERHQLAQRASSPSPMEQFIAALLRAGQASGEIVSDMPPERMAEYLRFLRLTVWMRWLASPEASLSSMNQEMLRLFLHGVHHKAQP
jgi:AcrR family transcriptional regulator